MKTNVTSMKQESKSAVSRDPGSLLLIIYTLIIIFFLLAGTLAQASASIENSGDEIVTFDDIRNGELLVAHDNTEGFIKAPLLSQDVALTVSGMVVNAKLKQVFRNDSNRWIEAVYAFPLPDESAVTRMQMMVGERVIVGEIKERQKARETYEKAKREGKKTSLLAQKRPNIFTMAVANIPPESTVEVEIEYVDMVKYENSVFSLRFPMVIGPRYIPGAPLKQYKKISFDEGGWAADSDQVTDASQITPPVAAPDVPARNPVTLTLSLAPGIQVRGLTSLYHGVKTEKQSAKKFLMRFDGRVYADRDFVVEYQAANEKEVTASLFSENVGGSNYQMLMLMPPVDKVVNEIPREVIFILDISGSMAGSSIRQAKGAMEYGVSRLHDRDRFNVITFNNRAEPFFSSAVSANSKNRQKAMKLIASLEADGGTEIAPALRLALDGRTDHGRIRQIVFLTDGAVGNERALFSLITERLGDSRLFTVGIGSAPNAYFMTRAAAMGRGGFSYIGKVEEVEEKMTALFEKLEHPVISSLKIETVEGEAVEMYPNPLPDLYSGEPLVGLVRSTNKPSSLLISGRSMGEKWRVEVGGDAGGDSPGISTLWARKKIRSLMESLNLGAAEEEVRRQVVETAVAHHLVSRYTSLVAVEQKVSRPQTEDLAGKQIKNNLPHGWQHEKVFATAAKTATVSQMRILLGVCLLLLSLALLRTKRVTV